jgi:hypothetical protein
MDYSKQQKQFIKAFLKSHKGVKFNKVKVIDPRYDHVNLWISECGNYIYNETPANSRGFGVKTPYIMKNKSGYVLSAVYSVYNREKRSAFPLNMGRLQLWAHGIYEEGDKVEVDHIDRNPLNNRIDNLHFVTRDENQNNRDLVAIKRKFIEKTPEWKAHIKHARWPQFYDENGNRYDTVQQEKP